MAELDETTFYVVFSCKNAIIIPKRKRKGHERVLKNQDVDSVFTKKCAIFGFSILLCILWLGSCVVIAYYSLQDLNTTREYQEIGVYTFSPDRIVKVRERRSGKGGDKVSYYVEYNNPETDHIWRQRVSNSIKGETILTMGISQERRVLESSRDYVTIPVDQMSQAYIQTRVTRDNIGLWGAIIIGVGIFIFVPFLIQRHMKFLKNWEKEKSDNGK